MSAQFQFCKPSTMTIFLQVLIATCCIVAVTNAVAVESNSPVVTSYDSPALRLVSDEDQANMQQIKNQIANDFTDLKSIKDVIAFLDDVKLLVQKHPKNVAFAQGELKELFRFLSQEIVTRLIRVDTDPFAAPLTDERLPLAQRAVEEDELTRKLFSAPLQSHIEAKRQQTARAAGNYKDGNFFSSLWCKITNSACSNN